MDDKVPDRAELDTLVARGKSLAHGLEVVEAPGLAEDALHVYGRRRTAESLRRLLDDDLGRLAAAIRRLAEESGSLREDLARARTQRTDGAPTKAAAPAAVPEGADTESLGGLLSAPFRVSPASVSAAKTDPLQALAVQVARAMGEDSKEIERARLIAMAFAATRGDMDAFWTARKQRAGTGAKKATSGKKG